MELLEDHDHQLIDVVLVFFHVIGKALDLLKFFHDHRLEVIELYLRGKAKEEGVSVSDVDGVHDDVRQALLLRDNIVQWLVYVILQILKDLLIVSVVFLQRRKGISNELCVAKDVEGVCAVLVVNRTIYAPNLIKEVVYFVVAIFDILETVI